MQIFVNGSDRGREALILEDAQVLLSIKNVHESPKYSRIKGFYQIKYPESIHDLLTPVGLPITLRDIMARGVAQPG